MIKANELRIGNIVWQGELYKESIVTSYELNQFSDYNRGVTHLSEYYKEWKPIPLTEEWLVKFGFEKADIVWFDKSVSKQVFLKGNYFFNIDSEGIALCEITSYSGQKNNHYIKRMDYVHQLQNLYFALTGEELTIK